MGGLSTVPSDQERAPAESAEIQRDRGDSDRRKRGNILSQFMQDRHKRVSRMLGYTLVLGEPDAWGGFSVVCRARLTICERAGLAVAALRSLPDDYQLSLIHI